MENSNRAIKVEARFIEKLKDAVEINITDNHGSVRFPYILFLTDLHSDDDMNRSLLIQRPDVTLRVAEIYGARNLLRNEDACSNLLKMFDNSENYSPTEKLFVKNFFEKPAS